MEETPKEKSNGFVVSYTFVHFLAWIFQVECNHWGARMGDRESCGLDIDLAK